MLKKILKKIVKFEITTALTLTPVPININS